jgi:hypothetical protein
VLLGFDWMKVSPKEDQMTKRAVGIIAGIVTALSTCLLFISSAPASAQPDFYLYSPNTIGSTPVFAKYNATAKIWRSAADTATEVSENCLNSGCTKIELQQVGTGDCMEYVTGTGVTNASCTGDARQSWELFGTACSHFPSGDYVLENVYFTNEVLTATTIGDGLTIGSLTCDLNQAWEFDTQGP